ncbi:hypothetical protein N7517_010890 [Penicillium concentricum]|uniref:Uncharacterized protein n=1 Tax=Penicillium concentricum TaxID=293559 RepID=A0A9W9R9Y4_9EURO|nr:uncharacterized protein N7517_010890 [Penicillium concentricum]KAJ5356281.1 hypothetical protein N7517_010890 [Penicillium concentricum]
MSSPIKLEGSLSEMKQADARLLVYASLCHEGKIDMEKLAGLLGMKKTSASTNYYRARGRLQAILGEGSPINSTASKPETATKSDPAAKSDTAVKSEDQNTGSPVKKSRTRNPGVDKNASTKTVPAKRRKAAVKAESEPTEESAQTDNADDTANLTE